MKNFIVVLILLLGFSYYFIPYETKVTLLEKVGVDSSFLKSDKSDKKVKGEVVKLTFDADRKKTYSGNISDGVIMPDLSWASKSYVKCFYEKDYINFNGNVTLHRIYLPKNKKIVVKLISDKLESNLSMYVYKIVVNNNVYPPLIEYVHDCKIDITKESTKIIEMKGNTAPSDIVIGVSGANGLLEGGYTLEMEEK